MSFFGPTADPDLISGLQEWINQELNATSDPERKKQLALFEVRLNWVADGRIALDKLLVADLVAFIESELTAATDQPKIQQMSKLKVGLSVVVQGMSRHKQLWEVSWKTAGFVRNVCITAAILNTAAIFVAFIHSKDIQNHYDDPTGTLDAINKMSIVLGCILLVMCIAIIARRVSLEFWRRNNLPEPKVEKQPLQESQEKAPAV